MGYEDRKRTVRDLVVNPNTRDMLGALGSLDALKGISQHDGWHSVAKECDFAPFGGPAQEAYLDGWFKGAIEKNKERP